MASISSLTSSSSTSSIYGNRNIISGLASGMDTEAMIENAVSGIKTKIQTLQQKRTKIEWQQEAFRSIIDKAVNFNTKYTSYTSKTNLLSSSFFTNAVNTSVLGTYADKITASGKSSSDIKINAVKQMATAASYTVSGLGGGSNGEISAITGGKFDITGTTAVNTISGSLTLKYGGTNGSSFSINFEELEDLNEIEVLNDDGSVNASPTNAEKLAQAIRNKLSEVTYNYTENGFAESSSVDKVIKVTAQDGQIKFSDGLGYGNSVSITSATGNMKETLGITSGDTSLKVGSTQLMQNKDTTEYLSGKELSITFNGVTKKIDMSKVVENSKVTYDDPRGMNANMKFVQALQSELDSAFGSGKISVSQTDGKLSFETKGEGNTMTLSGTAVKGMGFETGDSNYLNTGKKLSELLGDKSDSIFSNDNLMRAVGTVKTQGNHLVDEAGNTVKLLTDKDGRAVKGSDGKDIYYRVNTDGDALYDFQVNGTSIAVTEDTTLESLMNSINSNSDAGVKVSYSKLTNEFKFTATETGANGKIEFGALGSALFGTVDEQPALSGDTQLKDIFTTYSSDNFGDSAFKIKANINGVETELTANVYWGGDGAGTTLASIEKQLNTQLKDSGVTATYNERTNSFDLTDKDGKAISYTYDEDSMAARLADSIGRSGSAGNFTGGQDAIMDVEINGVRFENLTRSSNSFDLDGLTVNVKGTFNEDGSNVDKDGNTIEPVTFNTTTDTETIINAIRDFVNDYNEMATEIKNAYSTTPAQKSDGSRYDPLTAEEEAQYSESELASYNEKAKQGLLFGDTTLSSFYSKLLSTITPGGADGQTLREIGIGTSYSDGMTTLSLDEDKLRAALESDPDKVKNAFTKTKESGSSSDGLMQSMQNTLNTYVKTTGEPKGSLIVKAGSIKAPTSLNSNSLKSQIDSIDSQIERWQDKMSTQIDRYTTQFTRLEKLISQMNSQYSAMSGLMGGDSGY